MKVSIAKLNKDGLQTRIGLDERTVRDYAEQMADGRQFDPVTVYKDTDGTLRLADGFHRAEAAVRVGMKSIDAKIERGGYVNALRHSLKCNAKHGLRLTNDDKANALRIAWEHRRELFGPNDPTADWLAQSCGVSKRTAEDFYAAITAANCGDLTDRRQNAEGRVYTLPQRPVRPVRPVMQAQPTSAPVRPSAPVAPSDSAEPVPSAVQQAPAPARPTYRDNQGGRHCVPLDRFGVEIPIPLQVAFEGDDANKLAQLVRLISEARCIAAREIDTNAAFAALRQEVHVQLDNAYNFAKAAKAHCVCRMCQGHGCKACHGRGWQTEEEYDRNPDDFKAVEVQS